MPNPDPIQQNIKVTADTAGADETVQSLDEVRAANERMVAAAEKSAERDQANSERARKLAGALSELQREELAYQAALDGGAEANSEDAQAAAGRRTEIDRLAAELAGLEDEQDRVNKAVRESVSAHRASEQATSQAARAERSRDQIMAGYRTRLEALIRAQLAYEDTTQKGTRATNTERRAAERREQQIRRLGRAIGRQEREQRRVNAAIRDASGASDQAASSSGLLGRAIDSTTGSLTAMAGGFLGTAGVISLYQKWIERIEISTQRLDENSEAAQRNAQARLNLAALQGVESDEDLERISTLASFAARDPGEVARLGGVLKSQFPSASEDQLNELAREAAAQARLNDTPLTDLGQGLSVLFRQTGDARVAGNILQEAIQQAGEADPGRLSKVIGQFVGVGEQVGGLDTGQAAGFAAAATSLNLPNEQAITGLRNVIFAIRDTESSTPGNELLNSLGISRDDPILALQQIAQANTEGRINEAQLITLAGREGSAVVSALADPERLGVFLESVNAVDAAEDFDGSIALNKGRSLFTPDSFQGLNLFAKTAEAELEALKASDKNSLRAKAIRDALQLALEAEEQKEGGGTRNITPFLTERILGEFDAQVGLGRTPEDALIRAERVPANLFGPDIRIPAGLRGRDSGELVSFDASVSQEENRAGFFSVPILRTLNEGVSDEPGLLLDRIESQRLEQSDLIRFFALNRGDSFGLNENLAQKRVPFAFESDEQLTGDALKNRIEQLETLLDGKGNLVNDVTKRGKLLGEILEREIERLRDRQENLSSDPPLELPADLQPEIDGQSRSDLSGGRAIINYGVINTGAGDPLIDDLDGRARV